MCETAQSLQYLRDAATYGSILNLEFCLQITDSETKTLFSNCCKMSHGSQVLPNPTPPYWGETATDIWGCLVKVTTAENSLLLLFIFLSIKSTSSKLREFQASRLLFSTIILYPCVNFLSRVASAGMGPRGDYALAIAESLFRAYGAGSYNSSDLTNPTALNEIGASCNNPLLQYILQYKTYLQIKI